MESEDDNALPAIRCAGDRVEIIDPRHPLHGASGTVKFFVGDNVYVQLAGKRRSSVTMFFLDQLRAAAPLPNAPDLSVVAGGDAPTARRPYPALRRPSARTRPST